MLASAGQQDLPFAIEITSPNRITRYYVDRQSTYVRVQRGVSGLQETFGCSSEGRGRGDGKQYRNTDNFSFLSPADYPASAQLWDLRVPCEGQKQIVIAVVVFIWRAS